MLNKKAWDKVKSQQMSAFQEGSFIFLQDAKNPKNPKNISAVPAKIKQND